MTTTTTVVRTADGTQTLHTVDPEILRAVGWDGWFSVPAWAGEVDTLTERLQRLDRAYNAVKAGLFTIANLDTGLLKLTPLGERIQGALLLEVQ